MSNKLTQHFDPIETIKGFPENFAMYGSFAVGAAAGMAISDGLVYTADKGAFMGYESTLDKLQAEVHDLRHTKQILEHDHPQEGEAGPGPNPTGFESIDGAINGRKDRIAMVEAKQDKVGYNNGTEIASDLGFGFSGMALVAAMTWAGITRRHRRQLPAQPKRLPIRTY